jgi:protein-S-isoprenylcysteine O-methyltransferase Ste14
VTPGRTEPGAARRIFGSGPAGTLASIALLVVAAFLQRRLDWPALGLPHGARLWVLAAGLLATIVLVAWSVRSLPVDSRGRELCTSGAFARLRHPLYAAFLLFFCPALAIYLDHTIYIAWAVALHPVWHAVIRGEEALMAKQFGDEWERYAARTGRFIPRVGSRPARARP